MEPELFEQLVDRFLDGGLSADQQLELETAIQTEPALRTRFWELSRIHGQLRSVTQEEQGRSDPLRAAPITSSMPRRSAPLRLTPKRKPARQHRVAWPFLAAAASIAIAVAVLFPQWAPTLMISTERDAVIHDVANAVWADGESWAVGDVLGDRPLTLTTGLVQIRFSSGATMIVAGPAQVSAQGPKQATLHTGRITMRVPEPAHGFAVNTADMQIIDLGTEFGVSERYNQSQPGAEVVVFDGSVEATALQQSITLPKILRRGEASRIDGQSGLIATTFHETGYIRAMPNELAAAHLERDLEAWYKFEETTGTHVNDASGNEHHGTLRHGTIENMATTGRVNGAFEFNGTTHVEVPNHPKLSLTEFTLHAWIKPQEKQGHDAQILSKQGSYGLALPSNSAMKFYFWHMDRVVDHTFAHSEWVNLIATFDGTVRRFYVNGIRIATITSPTPPISPEPLRLGALEGRTVDPTRYFRGTIDDIRIYRRALGEDEVRLLYLSAPQPQP